MPQNVACKSDECRKCANHCSELAYRTVSDNTGEPQVASGQWIDVT